LVPLIHSLINVSTLSFSGSLLVFTGILFKLLEDFRFSFQNRLNLSSVATKAFSNYASSVFRVGLRILNNFHALFQRQFFLRHGHNIDRHKSKNEAAARVTQTRGGKRQVATKMAISNEVA
jgi:hypothetical protein